ncbi:MAG: hypothetical protein ACI81L_003441 [Verrucomicrobiales bacterium]|jgi:hypothetical protein
MTMITRSDRLGDHYTPRSLDQFVTPQPPEEVDLGVHASSRPDDLLAKILSHKKWRHHHGIPELQERGDLYVAYVRRIEEMLSLIRDGLERYDLLGTLPEASISDLAASEGFVTTRLIDWGATSVDAFELSEGGVDRYALLWHYLGYAQHATSRMFRLDFEQVNWAAQLPQTYDMVFSLGIIYHLENPLLFARNLYASTNDVCVMESDTPIFPEPLRFRGNGVVYLNKDQVTIGEGNIRKLIEFRPDQEALIDIMLTAGFSSVEVLKPDDPSSNTFFGRGEKSILLCRK